MSDIELTNLDDVWDESTGTPLTLFETTDPKSQTGSYVIQPGERAPEEGWTSHESDEISVILDGEITLTTTEGEYTVGSGTLSVISAGTKHYSVNETDMPVKLVYTTLGGL
ncbi:cupin [Haladaptatus sp. R4]|uniref:cupin domain-containing protein n=1 Tax=Haladaptatus sp. R4 TaxID=1679489 RepID=UPI0007B460C1|nr:cupin domain-containing protein [Haladaptatus sp. R4]KZN23066.1 cupin [Haladaptatus sp. R4]